MEPEPDNYHVLHVACCATCKYWGGDEGLGFTRCDYPGCYERRPRGRGEPLPGDDPLGLCDRYERE